MSTVSSDFASAVHALPTIVTNHSNYINFISAFGTHYVSVIVMGAKAVIQSEFEQTAWTRMQEKGINVNAAASASFGEITGGALSGTEIEQKLRNEFNSMRISYKAAHIGSQPSTDGKWETWASTSGKSPYPIEYTLLPISELFDVKNFMNMSQNDLDIKCKLLSDAFNVYCNGLPNCGLPTPDRVPVKMDLVASDIRGAEVISCRPGYSLLSCGMDNVVNTEFEAFRKAYPVNPTSCYCYDYYGAKCLIWCTNSIEGFEIQKSTKSGLFQVSCPAEKKVVGCHITPTVPTYEPHRAYYPNDDGNSCQCYDYFDAECIASCAANIYDYEIRKQFGHGVVTVYCSESNFVLGCGINPMGDSQAEHWRTMYVSSINSCTCYDYFGTNCFAICGKFK